MEEKNTTQNSQIEILDARKTPARVMIIAAIILALAFGWFAVRWQLGDMLASLTPANAPNAGEVAELAVNLAPGDPLTHWLAAGTKKDVFSPDVITSIVEDYKSVIRLSPNDYRWWVELGRAAEQAENYDEAETAFNRAAALAPNYSYVHWQLGNFYLRRNKSDAAFAELRKAAETSYVYRDQVFSLAWDFYDHDTNKLEQIAGDYPPVRATLARFYAGKERAEDALRVWNSLSEEDKKRNAVYAQVIAQGLYEMRYFRQSQEFFRELGVEPDAKPETIQNGSFEKAIKGDKETYFGWIVSKFDKMDVKLDPTKKHDGNYSLRVTFNGYSDPALYNITQYVVVKPSAKYRLTFWLRTEELKSGGPPMLEIFNTKDLKAVAVSDPFPNGTNDWQQIEMNFTAPENAEAVAIRTNRSFCGEGCPIYGTIWYDDFKLEKINK